MDWKDVGEIVGKVVPTVGALFGPLGAGLGELVSAALGVPNTPADIAKAVQADPEAALKLQAILSDENVKIQAMQNAYMTSQVQALSENIKSINTTMQTEAASDHWPTYSWRPFIGFCVGLNTLAASLLVLMVFVGVLCGNALATAAVAQLPTVLGTLAAISATVMPVLGIASWFRGKAQADPGIPTDNRG